MDGIQEGFLEVKRGRHVVRNAGGSVELRRSALTRLPDSEELDEKVIREAGVEHLADKEDVGAESRLKHDRHVRGVEQADRIGATHATLAGRLDGDFDAESLEIDHGGEDDKGSEEVHDVGQVLAVEGFAEGSLLIGPRKQEMEESNDGTLELRTTAGVDGGRRERLPDDRFADVGRNEQGDSTSKTISLLQELIKQDNHEASHDQLDDQQDANTGAEIARLAIQTGKDVYAALAEGKDNRKQFLGGLVELAVGFEVKVDVNKVGSGKKLSRRISYGV
jgi:hypothetical protein